MLKISINPAQSDEATGLQAFIRRVFDEAVAPHYSDRGKQAFYLYIESSAIVERLKANHWILKAENPGELLGVIEIRNNAHLSMFFVSPEHQRQGVGRQLLAAAITKILQSDRNLKRLTVNASPNSIQAYRALGFSAISAEKEMNGIRFTTMEKAIDWR